MHTYVQVSEMLALSVCPRLSRQNGPWSAEDSVTTEESESSREGKEGCWHGPEEGGACWFAIQLQSVHGKTVSLIS